MHLVTWNTQWCRGVDGTVNVRRIVDGARAMAHFDVLCLQEIASGFEGMAGAPGDQPAEVQALLPEFRVFFGAAVDEFDAHGQRRRFGNLIATRLPVASLQHHPLPWPADRAVSSMPRMWSVLTLRDPALGAVRVMTTHLEYHSHGQRLMQARALRELHAQACAQAADPPLVQQGCSPFQPKAHTPYAILCGDFNCAPETPEYAAIQEPFWPPMHVDTGCYAINSIASARFHDVWPLLHGSAAQPPTFRLHKDGVEPIACDFVFVSDTLARHLRRIEIDGRTQASDHQPVLVELC